jgi:hypothetical protein
MTTFYPFGTAQGGIVLPVELIRFEGRNDGEQNILQWATASELNNDHFTLERSIDGVEFTALTRIAGAGTTNTLRNYEYVDVKPFLGINYYRLTQTDFDGTENRSDIIAIVNKGSNGNVMSVRPNPASGHFFIDMSSDQAGSGVIRITDLTGRVVISQQVELESGFNTFQVDISRLSKGMYAVTFNSESKQGFSARQLVVNGN